MLEPLDLNPDECVVYKSTEFSSYLHATWALFFDSSEIEWIYQPKKVGPFHIDFEITFYCGHSECPFHTIYIRVLDCDHSGEVALAYNLLTSDDVYLDYGIFGSNLEATVFDICHGHGCGQYGLTDNWLSNLPVDELWEIALQTTDRLPVKNIYSGEYIDKIEERLEIERFLLKEELEMELEA